MNLQKRRISRIDDYILRGALLKDLSLWDFVAQVDKVPVKKDQNNEIEGNSDDDNNIANGEDDMLVDNAFVDVQDLLNDLTKVRPTSTLLSDHRDFDKALRYQEEMFLPPELDTAGSCLCSFVLGDNADTQVTKIMDNMQILHECKESQDEHMKKQKLQLATFQIADKYTECRQDLNEVEEEPKDEDIYLHLQNKEDDRSNFVELSNRETQMCIESAASGNFFNPSSYNLDILTKKEALIVESTTQLKNLEASFQRAYDDKCKAWKKKNQFYVSSHLTNAEADLQPEVHCGPFHEMSEDGATPAIGHLPPLDKTLAVNVNVLIAKWTLSEDQESVFHLITNQSMLNKTSHGYKPLRMFLSGAAGTGKSRVLNAIKDYFKEKNELRQFRSQQSRSPGKIQF
ncbi:hypothetical protein DXG01_016783 [Tephrocybe rancida]|nr:hypothetical protein DXG01_016783 [Tephrocybe rancida]